MNFRRRFESIIATLLLLAGFRLTAIAQDADANISYPSAPASQTSTDPPGRVARIQYMSGEVSIQPRGINDWIAANMNRPLTTSDRVWTDKNSKAELNVGGGYIRLNSETSLTLSNISDNTVQLELDQGTLEMTVRYLGPGQIYEVDTPNVAFTVMKTGVYRFNVFPNEDQTWVTVRQGQGEATGRGNAVKIKAGEQVRFSGGNSLQHTAEAAPAPDGFDDWARVRDQRLDSSQSARYVSPGVIGYEDLDGNGAWQTVAPYGPVWVPYSVPAGWAPYRFGHWVWIAPWGWTWVDDAPWGFAPFHYGRWVNWGGYWGWAPGPYRFWHPCYAPALVAWVGGPGWGLGFGFGGGWGVGVNFGWFPLGWGEPFYPCYRGWHGHGLSSAYVRNINVTNTHITNITNITNNYYNNRFVNTHYVNRNINGAVTAAPASAIANGQPINRAGAPVPRTGLATAHVVRNISTTPTREAVLGGQAPHNNAAPPASAFSRNVVTRATPPMRPTFHGPAEVPASALSNTQASKEGLPGTPIGASATPGATTSRNPNAGPVAHGNNPPNVPRPPRTSSDGEYVAGRSSTNPRSGVLMHTVLRPPVQSGYVNGAGGTSAAGNSNTMHPATQPHSVPQPASASEMQHPAAVATPRTVSPAPTVHPASPPVTHESAAPTREATPHGAPQAKTGNANPGMASAVPRPSANYAYHASPAYSAGSRAYAGNAYAGETSHAASAVNSYQSGGNSSSAAPSYGGRTSYPPAAGYGSSPSYHSYTPAPAYNTAPAVPHYSGPSASNSSGSATHYAAPSGGGPHSYGGTGASHASHGSGGAHTR